MLNDIIDLLADLVTQVYLVATGQSSASDLSLAFYGSGLLVAAVFFVSVIYSRRLHAARGEADFLRSILNNAVIYNPPTQHGGFSWFLIGILFTLLIMLVLVLLWI